MQAGVTYRNCALQWVNWSSPADCQFKCLFDGIRAFGVGENLHSYCLPSKDLHHVSKGAAFRHISAAFDGCQQGAISHIWVPVGQHIAISDSGLPGEMINDYVKLNDKDQLESLDSDMTL